ncbi:Oidioi.mRNA.OKI2018_I69.XSR.g13489.t1.cds [Oikopleura dioica]|uniref:Oidioi.mRNA.OKI2018_I69.XSR.g13489.t1.cds n=1 Tax=Oikopleura dioica TaxID=34765 RepID=A0ABN7SFH3_OIKDI|nr:Oidioi.mRNA.OKI2018_I69.XSR.g13489.t1.cds [Oikopleura dioica]
MRLFSAGAFIAMASSSSLHCTPVQSQGNMVYRHCKCVNADGSDVPNSLQLIIGNSPLPVCAPAQIQPVLPVGNFAKVETSNSAALPTDAPLVDFEATTVDDHGFNPKEANALEPAKNLHSLPPCESRVTTCWCVDVKSGEARPGSRRTVSVDTINGALPDYGEPNLDHGKDCRAFGSSGSRPMNIYKGTATNSYLYNQNAGPSVRQDPTISSEPSPINLSPFKSPFESPVIYNPASEKSEYVQKPPATLSKTYTEKTEPMYRPNPQISHPKVNYNPFFGLFGRNWFG